MKLWLLSLYSAFITWRWHKVGRKSQIAERRMTTEQIRSATQQAIDDHIQILELTAKGKE